LNARTGELTPPGILFCAREKRLVLLEISMEVSLNLKVNSQKSKVKKGPPKAVKLFKRKERRGGANSRKKTFIL
jgi:hypothetical protein